MASKRPPRLWPLWSSTNSLYNPQKYILVLHQTPCNIKVYYVTLKYRNPKETLNKHLFLHVVFNWTQITCSIIVSNKDTYFNSFMSKEWCCLCHSFQRDGPSYLACWQDEICFTWDRLCFFVGAFSLSYSSVPSPILCEEHWHDWNFVYWDIKPWLNQSIQINITAILI